MLTKVGTLKGYKLHSIDGEIGKVEEFYFDDQHWTIRYLVANTGDWLTGRQVLLSPYALRAVNQETQDITVALTKKQIESSPSLSTDRPVSRQFEDAYYAYYGWSPYWAGSYAWGTYGDIAHDRKVSRESIRNAKMWDPNLCSTHDVRGHSIQAIDGEIGHVEDFIVDDATWTIHYMVVHTHNWLPRKKVLISPKWIERVSWDEQKVFVNLSCEAIKLAPEYTDEAVLTQDYEARLHEHYNLQGYWPDKETTREHSR